ncbi:MAG: hypothetical protein R3B06_19205 [Kofleriaceae bacterium]
MVIGSGTSTIAAPVADCTSSRAIRLRPASAPGTIRSAWARPPLTVARYVHTVPRPSSGRSSRHAVATSPSVSARGAVSAPASVAPAAVDAVAARYQVAGSPGPVATAVTVGAPGGGVTGVAPVGTNRRVAASHRSRNSSMTTPSHRR